MAGAWNIVATARDGEYRRARAILDQLGETRRTGFYNVLVLQVDDVPAFVERLGDLVRNVPDVLATIGHVFPAQTTFAFGSREDFEAKARDAVLTLLPSLAGKTFHVRLHRRGRKDILRSQEQERALDAVLLAALDAAGTPGALAFDDPDAVVDVETVDDRAGVSLWTRADRRRYPFLRLD